MQITGRRPYNASIRSLLILLALLFSASSSLLQAQEQPSPSPSATPTKSKPASTPHQDPGLPAPKIGPNGQPQAGFLKRHQQLVDLARKGNIDLYFLGDSITQHWENDPELWQKAWGAYHPGNFGISGDHTQHVLWRIENGELEGVHPKVLVLMIGTNNVTTDPPEATARAITKIVSTIREKLPDTKILLLAIFPRGENADKPVRKTNDQVNALISKLADNQHVFFLDLGPKFLQPDGTLSKDIMPDLLHPNTAGYQIWIDAMTPKLTELMK